MSQAFVREGEDQNLEDIGPSINSLIAFLTRDNNGVRVYETKTFTNEEGRQIHVMSNGLSYSKDVRSKWQIVD